MFFKKKKQKQFEQTNSDQRGFENNGSYHNTDRGNIDDMESFSGNDELGSYLDNSSSYNEYDEFKDYNEYYDSEENHQLNNMDDGFELPSRGSYNSNQEDYSEDSTFSRKYRNQNSDEPFYRKNSQNEYENQYGNQYGNQYYDTNQSLENQQLSKRAKYNSKVDQFLTNGIIIVGVLLLAILLIAFLG